MFSDVMMIASTAAEPINAFQAVTPTTIENTAIQSVFSYFFQVGFGLALGIALVVVPTWKIVTRQKPMLPNLRRKGHKV